MLTVIICVCVTLMSSIILIYSNSVTPLKFPTPISQSFIISVLLKTLPHIVKIAVVSTDESEKCSGGSNSSEAKMIRDPNAVF